MMVVNGLGSESDEGVEVCVWTKRTLGDVFPKSDRVNVLISSASSGGRETNIFRFGLDSNVFTTVNDCFRDPFMDDFIGDNGCDIFVFFYLESLPESWGKEITMRAISFRLSIITMIIQQQQQHFIETAVAEKSEILR